MAASRPRGSYFACHGNFTRDVIISKLFADERGLELSQSQKVAKKERAVDQQFVCIALFCFCLTFSTRKLLYSFGDESSLKAAHF